MITFNPVSHPITKSLPIAKKKPLMGYQRQRLLVIENNLALQKLVSRTLAEQGFEIQFAANGADGLALFTRQQPDLVLLNLTLPGSDGFEVCRRIREQSTTPIFVILGPDCTTDGVTALDIGADDCLIAPFNGDELRARVQALLRRTSWREQPNPSGAICIGDLQINFEAHQLIRGGEPVYLSQTEWRLLELLVRHSGKVVSHDFLHRSAWGNTNHKESSNLRSYIHRLRNKLEADPDDPHYLMSEPGVGYFFRMQHGATNPVAVAAKPEPSRLTNLSLPPTSFVGWAGEIKRVQGLLENPNVRLVSLIGPGGAGKTRLGLQVADRLVEKFRDGVYFVELAPVRDSNLVAITIAQALGVKAEPLLAETIKSFLKDKQMLLVLDNFEQVLGAATLVSDLLSSARGLKILVTSREVLHLYGEQEFEVPPLALPDPHRPVTLPDLMESPAVALFIDRARAVQPDFELTEHNAAAMADLCAHLDGLPLAIELAAARIKLLPLQAIAARLSNRLALLTNGAQNMPKRQQTMRNTLDWSYELLAPEEKVLFARMGVFVGGCTLEAVEAIVQVGYEPGQAIDALEQVPSLLHKSMLVREAVGDDIRFKMLGIVREYAYERLVASGDVERLNQKHAAYYLTLAESAQAELLGTQACSEASLNMLEREHDNMRAALSWAMTRESEIGLALRLATALGPFWKLREHLGEGRHWMEAILARSQAEPGKARAEAYKELAWLALVQGDYNQASLFLESGRVLWAELGNHPVFTLMTGLILDAQGKFEQALVLLESNLASSRVAGDQANIAFALQVLGQCFMKVGNYEQARIYIEESVEIRRKMGLKHDMARTLLTLGHITRFQGNYLLACEQYQKSLTLFEALGEKWGIGYCMLNMGKIACIQANYASADLSYRAALKNFDEVGDRHGLAYTLESMGTLAGLQMQPQRAARLWGAHEALRQDLGTPLPAFENQQLGMAVANLKAHLSELGFSDADFLVLWYEGRKMALKDVVAFASHF